MLFRPNNRPADTSEVAQVRQRRSATSLPAALILMALVCATFVSTLGSRDVSAQTVATIPPPTFGTVHGFYNSAFNLTLSAPGYNIRYTTNGSSPTATNGTNYSGAFNINRTTVVRAVAYSGSTYSSIASQTYIFLNGQNGIRNQAPNNVPPSGWPSRFAADDMGDELDPGHSWYPSDYEMDPQVLNHSAYNGQFETAMKSLPSLSISTDQPNLWNPDYGIYYNAFAKEPEYIDPFNPAVHTPNGIGVTNNWERPVSVEWIDPNNPGNPGTNFMINGGLRTHGQASRKPHRTPKKSFRLYFKKSYGEGSLDFNLFDYADPVGSFDRLVLRNGGNRSYPYFDRDQRREADYIQDEWARRAWLEMGNVGSRGNYVHLYLNGLYWGLYIVAERVDEKFLASYLGDKDTDYSVISADEDLDNLPVADPPDPQNYYGQVLALVEGNEPISNAKYDQIKALLDVENFADYFVHTHYIGKTDWPHHNWNGYRKLTGNDQRLKFYAWDNDSGMNKVTQDITNWVDIKGPVGGPIDDSPSRIFLRLTSNAEFRQVLSDRFYRSVLDPNGALTPTACRTIYMDLMSIVEKAILPESARWGDYVRDTYPMTNSTLLLKTFPAYLHTPSLTSDTDVDPTHVYTDGQQKSWNNVTAEKLSTYCPNRSNVLLTQYISNTWYLNTLKPPVFSQPGGPVPANYELSLNNTVPNTNTGDILYTLDNSDPRLEYGQVSPTAVNGGDLVKMNVTEVTRVKARVKDGSRWSPLASYTFYPPQPFENLVISEIHYRPNLNNLPATLDPEDYEFIELHNKGTTPIRLDNAYFSKGISYTFPRNTTIYGGQYLVIAGKKSTFQTRYGYAAFDSYRGKLSNLGEPVELNQAPDPRLTAYRQPGTRIDFVEFDNIAPWPTGADGALPGSTGASLCLTDVNADNNVAGNWVASSVVNGTPGSAGCTTNAAQAGVYLSPTAVAFDEEPIGQPSLPKQVRLANSGARPLNITALTMSNPEFSNTACPVSLKVAESCFINVTFNPTEAGARSGSLSVASNAPGGPHSVNLTGTGVTGTRALTLSAANMTFDALDIGATSPPKVLTVTNAGTLSVAIRSIAINGDFAHTTTCGATLAPGANCTVNVTFKPTGHEARTGTLSINSNAPGTPHTVALVGNGTGGTPAISVSVGELDFEEVRVSTQSISQPAAITNFGTGPATINITTNGDYSHTTTCGATLEAGASCIINVTFAPKTSGAQTGTLSITSNAPNSPHTVALKGIGTEGIAATFNLYLPIINK